MQQIDYTLLTRPPDNGAPKYLPKLRLIWAFVSQRALIGMPPTIREIQAACAISSTSIVEFYLRKLDAGGFIKLARDNRSRNIEVLIPFIIYKEKRNGKAR